MPIPITSNPLKCYPSAADGITITPSSTLWGDSAYAELITSTPNAWVLAGIIFGEGSQFFAHQWEVDVAVGASGSETVIATFRGTSGTTQGNQTPYLLPVLIDNIPSGSRVAARCRQDLSGTGFGVQNPRLFAVLYYEKPIVGTLNTTTQPLRCLPSGSDGIAITTSGTAWTDVSYVEVTAATSGDMALLGVAAWCGNNGFEYEIDVAIGASGSEQIVATIHDATGGTLSGGMFWVPFTAPIQIVSGTRIATRGRSDNASAGLAVVLVYMPTPLGTGVPSSFFTTKPVKVAPLSAAAVSPVAVGDSTWGAWSTLIASAADDLAVAGIVPKNGSNAIIQIGKGAAGSEQIVAEFRCQSASSNAEVLWRVPRAAVSGIASGDRVAVRTKSFIDPGVTLIYYEAFDSDALTPKTPKVEPDGTNGLADLISQSTAWANGPWVEFTSGYANDVAVYGIAPLFSMITEWEVDIGTGPSGSETVIATVRGLTDGSGRPEVTLPALLPVAAGTRISLRQRKASTSTNGVNAALLYYDDLTFSATSGVLMRRPRTIHGARVGTRQIPLGG